MDDRRRLSFGGVADLYDQARPSYPRALVDDVVEYAGAAGAVADRAVEVGAGTGKATVLFAARGLDVLGIEPSAEMAELARRNCAGYANVTIEQTEFERWRPPGHDFRLVFSGQAWHWISPDVRYVAARAALEEGGALAAFWNRPEWSACDLRGELGEVYRRHGSTGPGDPMNPAEEFEDDFWSEEIAAASGFDGAEVRRYRWQSEYTAAEYVALLGTHSPCLILDPPERERLLGDIAAVIDGRGGSFRMPYVTVLGLARAS
ncbi:MAG TPA: class I SAM-dependent methyltransferase [Solirubrobacteraceae bacterium]|nr:class I SAM-dependent methyltransferase [Solirubrobacteraceae bacterium]